MVTSANRNMQAAPSGGWEFWSRVYSDPGLRQEMTQQTVEEPTMSELLRSENLCRAELHFTSVPRLSHSQQNYVLDLIKREVGNVPMLGVTISNIKWVVRFYRLDDACRVMRIFNGYLHRNRRMIVKLKSIEMQEAFDDGPRTSRVVEKFRDGTWAAAEFKQLRDFEMELIKMVSMHVTGIALDSAMAAARFLRRRGLVCSAIDQWPLGVVRNFAPKIKLTGRYLSLPEQNNTSELLRKAAAEKAARVPVEPWEPMSPTEIRTEYNMIDYFAAFLAHFGPQDALVDLPIRLVAKSLTGPWPNTPLKLAEKVESLSPLFILVEGVLYLSSSVQHRRILVDRFMAHCPATLQTTTAMSASSSVPKKSVAAKPNFTTTTSKLRR